MSSSLLLVEDGFSGGELGDFMVDDCIDGGVRVYKWNVFDDVLIPI